MIFAIAAREIRGIYVTIMGWAALAVAQLLLAWLLFTQLEVYQKILPELIKARSPLGLGDLVISPTLSSAALLLIILIPLLGMGSLSDEKRSGRIDLLLSSPISPLQLVLGKWLGLLLAILPLLLMLLVMAVTLGLSSAPDSGRIAASFLGLLLLSAMAAAISLWLSALNEQPLAAAAMAWGLLFLLWLLDTTASSSLSVLSLNAHLQGFLRGLVRSSDLIYFIAVVLATLVLTTHRVWRMGGGK
ncbi:ABC transporter permease subunit [Thiolapillus sp.]